MSSSAKDDELLSISEVHGAWLVLYDEVMARTVYFNRNTGDCQLERPRGWVRMLQERFNNSEAGSEASGRSRQNSGASEKPRMNSGVVGETAEELGFSMTDFAIPERLPTLTVPRDYLETVSF